MQTPQSMQLSASTTALSSSMLIASLGHSETQVSQPVHLSLSTFAGIYFILSKTQNNNCLKNTLDDKLRNVTELSQEYNPFYREILT
jgi:hypothetical protein